MKYFIENLYTRNTPLFMFGAVCLALAVVFLILTKTTNTLVLGVNAWYKPFKFALSIALYAWTMGWYCSYLPSSFNLGLYNNAVIILLGFEVAYIALQAGRGQLSHYNVSSTLYSTLLFGMAAAATIVTIWTAYIGVLFCTHNFDSLPLYYLWSIRVGIVLFVLFSFVGFAMGANAGHTVGAADGGPGLPVVNWSKRAGDLRVAHFIGMHALQVLPLLSYYLLKNVKATLLVGALYGLLALFTLMQAVRGRPLAGMNAAAAQ